MKELSLGGITGGDPSAPHALDVASGLNRPGIDAASQSRAQLLISAHFGRPSARAVSREQAELVLMVTNPRLNQDILVGMRPGGGKTLAFEIAGRLRNIPTILFMAPLKSIAVDLVERMTKAQVPAQFWSPDCRPNQGIVLFALEDAGSADLHRWVRQHQTAIHCIVLDEIHGAAVDEYRTSAWAYIHRLRHFTDDPRHRVIPLIGLSGSLSPAIRDFTTEHFAFRSPVHVGGALNVPHISYSFHPVSLDPQGLVTYEAHFLDALLPDLVEQEGLRLSTAFPSRKKKKQNSTPQSQTLVLFPRVAQVDDAFERMKNDTGMRRYHSRVPPVEQTATLAAVRDQTCTLLFATSGAATGLDAAFTQVCSHTSLFLCALSLLTMMFVGR